ncbi:hypothetical protein PUN28_000911 [Cardiocondyla obscurior]|uniref:Secreted protein n=1 Tax=Cardiocondyla obscurior TaxID=286306 RepID=A0AAW2H1T0_9HYME
MYAASVARRVVSSSSCTPFASKFSVSFIGTVVVSRTRVTVTLSVIGAIVSDSNGTSVVSVLASVDPANRASSKSGTLAIAAVLVSVGGVFVITLIKVVPGDSEVGTEVVSPPFASGFAGVCVTASWVLLSAPNLEVGKPSAGETAVVVSVVMISGEDVVVMIDATVSLLLEVSLSAPLGTVALESTFVTAPVSLCRWDASSTPRFSFLMLADSSA